LGGSERQPRRTQRQTAKIADKGSVAFKNMARDLEIPQELYDSEINFCSAVSGGCGIRYSQYFTCSAIIQRMPPRGSGTSPL
jgi:hypothetical protein